MTMLAAEQADFASGEAKNSKRGVLSIQESGVFGSLSWCERYFALDGAKLSWYDDESHTGGKPRGTLMLKPTSVAVTADDGSGAENVFKVTGDGDDLLLQGSRFLSVKSWIASIKKSVEELTVRPRQMCSKNDRRSNAASGKAHRAAHDAHQDGRCAPGGARLREDSGTPQCGTGLSSSPRSSASLRGDDEVMELMQKCKALKSDLKEWGENASTRLKDSVSGLKLLTRKKSSSSMSLGKPMEGFLTKRAMSGKNSWKKRYFVLRPSGSHAQPYVSLKYMDKKTSKKVKGTISLSAHTSMKLVDDIKGHSFAFEVHEGSESLTVSPQTPRLAVHGWTRYVHVLLCLRQPRRRPRLSLESTLRRCSST